MKDFTIFLIGSLFLTWALPAWPGENVGTVDQQSGNSCWAHAGANALNAASGATKGSAEYVTAEQFSEGAGVSYGEGFGDRQKMGDTMSKVTGQKLSGNDDAKSVTFNDLTEAKNSKSAVSGMLFITGHAIAYNLTTDGKVNVMDSSPGTVEQMTAQEFNDWGRQNDLHAMVPVQPKTPGAT